MAVDGSQIEIALDQGEVKAGEFAEPICELELELLSGDTRGAETGEPTGIANRITPGQPEQSGAWLSSGAGQSGA